MKVVIVTEGGKNIGLGHITRCIALYQAFLDKKIQPFFLINGDESAYKFLKQQNIKFANYKINKLLPKINDFEVTVVDSYKLPKVVYENISGRVKLCVYIDDFNRIKYPEGIVLNGAIYAKKIKYSENPKIKYLLGSKYIPLRREFWFAVKKAINKKIKKILITIGATDFNKVTYKILKFLLEQFDFYFDVIVGKGFSSAQIKKIKNLNGKVNIFADINANKMRKLMLKADVCISGGGQTTYELARWGTPTIGICVAKNQLFNLIYWQKVGFIKYAGWYNDKNLCNKVKKYINQVNYKSRLKMSLIGSKFVDGQGARRVVEEIIKRYEKNKDR